MNSEHDDVPPPFSSRQKWHAVLVVSVLCASIVFGACFYFVTVELKRLRHNDDEAYRMASLLGKRIRSRGPQFDDVVQNLFAWEFGRSQPATLTERLWNRRYPAFTGKVKDQAAWTELNDLIGAVCEEQHYDRQLVVLSVRIDAE